jgi:hypothetical protein
VAGLFGPGLPDFLHPIPEGLYVRVDGVSVIFYAGNKVLSRVVFFPASVPIMDAAVRRWTEF